MRNSKAFSMVELIFVIILIGILASIGGGLLPDNHLLKYTNTITMKIKNTQKNAIGNDINGFNVPWSKRDDFTCIRLDEESLLESFSDLVKVNTTIPRICFDEYGRPYNNLGKLLFVEANITVKYNDLTKIISVLPMSGYVTLRD